MGETIDYSLVTSKAQPVTGWRYVDPNTKHEYGPHQSINALHDEIEDHRIGKQLQPIEDLNRKIYNHLATLPENKYVFVRISTRRSFSDMAKALPHAVEIFSKGEYVDEYEAKRRAKICITCPYNQEIQVGAIGRIADQRVEANVADKFTGYESVLKHCAICKCSLKAKIWFKQEVVKNSLDPDDKDKLPNGENVIGNNGKPIKCWQLDE